MEIETSLGQNNTVTYLCVKCSDVDALQFSGIVRALEVNSTLEIFKVGMFGEQDGGTLDEACCQALIRSLPKMKSLSVLEITLKEEAAYLKDALISAFKRNGSIRRGIVRAPFFLPGDQAKLDLYGERNVYILHLIRLGGLERVPAKRVPNVGKMLLECEQGPEWVYRLLIAQEDSIGRQNDDDDEDNTHQVCGSECGCCGIL
jgi:hypothetical protein